MTISYTRGVPNPPNNPSQDVGSMQLNTNAIDDIIDVDHFSFNDTVFSGLHKQTRFVAGDIGGQTSPPSTSIGQLALYSKLTGGSSQLFLIRDNVGGTEVALTPNPAVIGNVVRAETGFSWLPGNLLIQWGLAPGIVTGGASVNFLQPFDALGFLPIVNITPRALTTSTQNIYLVSTTNTQFNYFNNNSAITHLYWIAIGPI